MKEETRIAFKDQTGLRISKCDLTTGKVVINGIEITSIEDWEKVTKSIIDLQSQLKAKEEAENTFKEWIATEQFRLARSVSHTYKDSLNKTHLVNEDIFDELAIVLDKYNEILSKGENK